MTRQPPEIRVLHEGPDIVGEAPLWVPETGMIWWCDIEGRAVRRKPLEGGAAQSFSMDRQPSALALTEDGGLFLAAGTCWGSLSEDGDFAPCAAPDTAPRGWRMNDGAPDREGRFWTGSLASPRDSGVGGDLYRLGAEGPVQMLDGLKTQNGLAVSPDGETLYLSDSDASVCTIWAFDLDRASGALSNRRIFHRPAEGRPDGAAIDAEGCYWFAAVDAGRIVRLSPEGRELRHIALPVSRPTNLAFAGEDLRTLCVTSMSLLPEGRDPAAEPLAGALFALDPGVAGLPVPRVARAVAAPARP
ncbi:SMP-30/gluconolactonase/LRE family protein [Pseudooceanicola nanhaiensis]|uniref:SMP-30/gluconolactonase/LRE family protein n=1 Tax=Pseudooceanicola nanhaiensis TaxID=375761 RepID=UPI00405A1B30